MMCGGRDIAGLSGAESGLLDVWQRAGSGGGEKVFTPTQRV